MTPVHYQTPKTEIVSWISRLACGTLGLSIAATVQISPTFGQAPPESPRGEPLAKQVSTQPETTQAKAKLPAQAWAANSAAKLRANKPKPWGAKPSATRSKAASQSAPSAATKATPAASLATQAGCQVPQPGSPDQSHTSAAKAPTKWAPPGATAPSQKVAPTASATAAPKSTADLNTAPPSNASPVTNTAPNLNSADASAQTPAAPKWKPRPRPIHKKLVPKALPEVQFKTDNELPQATAETNDSSNQTGTVGNTTRNFTPCVRSNSAAAIIAAATKLAHDKVQKGDYLGAIDIWTRILETRPHQLEALIARAAISKQIGDIRGALTDLDRAVEVAPSNANALIARAAVRRRLNDLRGAEDDVNRAVELAPHNYQAYYERASLRFAQGDMPGAMNDYNYAYSINPELGKQAVRTVQPQLAKNKDTANISLDEKLSHFSASLTKRNPNGLQVDLGRELPKESKESKENKDSRDSKDSKDSKEARGDSFKERRPSREAGDSQIEALNMSASQLAHLNNSAVQEINLKHFDAAIKILRELVAAQPDYQQARDNLVIAHNNFGLELAMRHPAEAVKQFRAALFLEPGQSATRKNLSSMIRELGMRPNNADDRLSLAEQCLRENDYQGAYVELSEGLRYKNSAVLRKQMQLALAGLSGETVAVPAQISPAQTVSAQTVSAQTVTTQNASTRSVHQFTPRPAASVAAAGHSATSEHATSTEHSAASEHSAAAEAAPASALASMELPVRPGEAEDELPPAPVLGTLKPAFASTSGTTEALASAPAPVAPIPSVAMAQSAAAPTTAQNASLQSTNWQAINAQAINAQAINAQPINVQEATLQSTTAQSATAQSTTAQSATAQSTTAQSAAMQAAVAPLITAGGTNPQQAAATIQTRSHEHRDHSLELAKLDSPSASAAGSYDHEMLKSTLENSPEEVLFMAKQFIAERNYLDAEVLLRKMASHLRSKGWREEKAESMLDTTLETLSELYLQMGNYQHAEPVLKELITLRERAKGPNDPILGKTVVEYTQVLRSLGRTAEADRLEVKANAILNRTLTAH
jgi:tetratricopeptide (TPR) repeat protein